MKKAIMLLLLCVVVFGCTTQSITDTTACGEDNTGMQIKDGCNVCTCMQQEDTTYSWVCSEKDCRGRIT